MSPLKAFPTKIAIPGHSELSFDVQLDDSVMVFKVRYTIIEGSALVRFDDGSVTKVERYTRTAAMMKVKYRAAFICRAAGQATPEFAWFTVKAEVLVDDIVECAPLSDAQIRVIEWHCATLPES